MAGFYKKSKAKFAAGQLSWANDGGGNIKALLVDTGLYTVDLTNHEFLSDIPAGARIAMSGALDGLSVDDPVGGVLDADDETIFGVTGGTVEATVFLKDTGVASTSPLIIFNDNIVINGGPPPLTPDGGDVTLTFDNGGNRIGVL